MNKPWFQNITVLVSAVWVILSLIVIELLLSQ